MTYFLNNLGQVWSLTLSHLILSVIPVVLGFAFSLPIGWFAFRYRFSRPFILTLTGILYAIPSLPLFFAMPAFLGTRILDPVNLVAALTLYALALMVRSTVDALMSVSEAVIVSAMAVGFSRWQRLWLVEFPLAGPVLLAGLRVVSVSTISLVSIGALLGIPNLGQLFTDGLNRSYPDEVGTGIVLIMVLALVCDRALVLAGWSLMPWTRRPGVDRRREMISEAVVRP